MRLFVRTAIPAAPSLLSVDDRDVFPHAAPSHSLLQGKPTHRRPGFSLGSIRVVNDNRAREVAVSEEAVHFQPFGTLLHLKKEGITGEPRVLLVAPMSGHFASRLRNTAGTMLADHDVYVTDWHNARDVPESAGRFGLDEYVQYLIQFLEVIGPGVHVVSICQSCVAALAATSIMAEQDHPAQPRSLTLMAGPIDTRINPTSVNRFAGSAPIEWFERNFITTVPSYYAGARRRVYPGFLQLNALMHMNLERHMNFFEQLDRKLFQGYWELAGIGHALYEEYFAVMDLTAEFYLETMRVVFKEHSLPLGKLEWCERVVRPSFIRRTALLTVEGEHDDICAVGQTAAAHNLCSGIPDHMKSHLMQFRVGHDGVFRGKIWNDKVYPVVREMIFANR
jgi:poly(3-hydroxybutyrate) depolymerase